MNTNFFFFFSHASITNSHQCNNHGQDLKTWVQGKQEVEVVDMILRIRQKLERSCIDDVPIDNSVRERLRDRINDITHVLPDDLKVILRHES